MPWTSSQYRSRYRALVNTIWQVDQYYRTISPFSHCNAYVPMWYHMSTDDRLDVDALVPRLSISIERRSIISWTTRGCIIGSFIIFGILSDRFGRKWPRVFRLLLCCVLELGTGFVRTFPQFLALRALFGVPIGGTWGLSSSSALENLPAELRGIGSGFWQEDNAVGYLIAAVINLTSVAGHA
ncbi:major facilitator superfamily domain-containing protein [Suillus paluster]|uniref:major facilitator superfamily domain-containing protein n=1 Tax=Suillus paluster TaxID=48578 RepID=UPI001B8791C2|nr:major facilitator superfamily domain-containing protein [Suillus paluster]KAG1732451.1 major facilitator superfamily domain-containing protein [Suillus paluster]